MGHKVVQTQLLTHAIQPCIVRNIEAEEPMAEVGGQAPIERVLIEDLPGIIGEQERRRQIVVRKIGLHAE